MSGRNTWRSKCLMRSIACVLVLIVTGCGSTDIHQPRTESPDTSAVHLVINEGLADPAISTPDHRKPNDRLQALGSALTSWHSFLRSPAYAGALVVKFTDRSQTKHDGRQWVGSNRAITTQLNALWANYRPITPERAIPLDEEIINRARHRAAREGKSLLDWNRVFLIPIENAAHADQLLADLFNSEHVEWAHPAPIFKTTDVTASDVSDISSSQTYLTNGAGGLNITQPSTEFELTGAGQTLFDVENNWNYSHKDLPLNITSSPAGLSASPGANNSINHGTAVVGIIAGQPNDFGITGISPNTTVRTVADGSGVGPFVPIADVFKAYALGQSVGGETILFEIGSEGPASDQYAFEGTYSDITDCPGCVPVESLSGYFQAIQNLVSLGVVVVEAAGNGVANLDDPIHQFKNCGATPCPNLATDDTGALMVGGSTGPTFEKADFSNCGSRVNVFAWGQGVVTTGYGDYGLRQILVFDEGFCIPYDWGTLPPAELQTKLEEHVCPAVPSFCAPETEGAFGQPAYHCPADHIPLPNSTDIQTAADFTYWYDDDPNTAEIPPDDENYWYTAKFNGTSSATAIIGGMVPLLQEYVDKQYEEDLEEWQHAYLNSAQIRELFTHPTVGTAQSDDGCNIGVQPDFGKALALLVDGTVQPTIANKSGYCNIAFSSACEEACTANPLDPDADCGGICAHDPTHPLCAQWCHAKADSTFDFDPFTACGEDIVLDKPEFFTQWCLDKADDDPTFNPVIGCTDLAKAHSEPFAQWCVEKANSELPGQGFFSPVTDCAPLYQAAAPSQDIDGDGRADLVAWSRDGKWYVDLSDVDAPGSADGFGQWDLTFTPPGMPQAGRLFPVVQDYDSNGQADLALYNADTGKWYVKHTNDSLLAGSFDEWDDVLDYSSAPGWQAGSRPVPGDYDLQWHALYNSDNGTARVVTNVDVALVRPDGHWLFDYRDENSAATNFDLDLSILSSEQLSQAPAWAYLPTPYPTKPNSTSPILFMSMAIKFPDGVSNGEKLYDVNTLPSNLVGSTIDDFYEWPAIFGPNSTTPIPGQFGSPWFEVGLKNGSTWEAVHYDDETVNALSPATGYGGPDCRPVAADYDGDGIDDRTVLCLGGEWRIAYSSDTFTTNSNGFRVVDLDTPFQALPGCVHPGGTDYEMIVDVYDSYNFGCTGGESCTINDLKAPTGPYFTECLTYWSLHPLKCLDY